LEWGFALVLAHPRGCVGMYAGRVVEMKARPVNSRTGEWINPALHDTSVTLAS
jgi:hypothetical protein